jgi:DNA-binding MurR/RpiR family transcriptional regulator
LALRDALIHPGFALTPSETRIDQVLLNDYPLSGLGAASSLAKRADVSDPTVVRLVVKLGFSGFPDFQAKLLEEVEARLRSPLALMGALRRVEDGDDTASAYLVSVSRGLERTRGLMPAQAYDRAADLIWQTRRQVLLLGGRFSRNLATMLAGYLNQLRRGVRDIGPLNPEAFDLLIDLDKRDLLIVFDYRRYQSDVIAFATQAAERGARILLFTDSWLSPIADFAEVTMTASIEVDSPYDTLAPAVAQMEAVVAHGMAAPGRSEHERMEAIERVRRANAVTLDDPDSTARVRARSAKKT